MEELEIIEVSERTETWKIRKKTPENKRNKYWKYHPAKKKDDWTPLKKSWRAKGHTTLNEAEIKLEVWKMVNWMTFWKSEITHPDNKKEKVMAKQPLTITQACREFGIHPQTFWQHLKKFPEAAELYRELKNQRREYLKELSEWNIARWLEWGLWLTWKELMDASFKMLEKTDKAYQPKLEVENKSISINLHKKTDDIMAELTDVLWINR